jgi:hypothetical protein
VFLADALFERCLSISKTLALSMFGISSRMKNLVSGMSIYFETPTQRLLTLGGNAYEQSLVTWDEECLWHHPSQDLSITHPTYRYSH